MGDVKTASLSRSNPHHRRLANNSYVVIHSQPDGTWLAETPTYPMCKGEASTPDKALDALINSVSIHITNQATSTNKGLLAPPTH